MVVSFRFFLTLNPDDGAKPTPTMETHVPPEGDGKSPLTTIKARRSIRKVTSGEQLVLTPTSELKVHCIFLLSFCLSHFSSLQFVKVLVFKIKLYFLMNALLFKWNTIKLSKYQLTDSIFLQKERSCLQFSLWFCGQLKLGFAKG